MIMLIIWLSFIPIMFGLFFAWWQRYWSSLRGNPTQRVLDLIGSIMCSIGWPISIFIILILSLLDHKKVYLGWTYKFEPVKDCWSWRQNFEK